MFGFSTKEKAEMLVMNASQNLIENYIEYCRPFFESPPASEEEANQLIIQVRRRYLDDVANSVMQFFQNANPRIFLRLQDAFVNPNCCGLHEYNTDNGVSAGELYAMCHYAMSNKSAKPIDCSRISHMQVAIMEQALIGEYGE